MSLIRVPPKGKVARAPGFSRIARSGSIWTAAQPGYVFRRGRWFPGTLVNPVVTSGPPGKAVLWEDNVANDSGLNFASAPDVWGLGPTGMTALVWAQPIAEANVRVAVSLKGSGFFVNQMTVGFNMGDNGPTATAESGSVTLYWRDLFAFTGNARSTSQIDGLAHCWVLRAPTAPGSATIHRDGVLQSLASTFNTFASSPTFSGSENVAIGNWHNTTNTTRFSYPLFMVAVWNHLLTESQAQWLSAEPTRLYAPTPSIVHAFAASIANSVPVLSNATAVALSSTSVRPRVTVTF